MGKIHRYWALERRCGELGLWRRSETGAQAIIRTVVQRLMTQMLTDRSVLGGTQSTAQELLRR